jgi:hypothetical protein
MAYCPKQVFFCGLTILEGIFDFRVDVRLELVTNTFKLSLLMPSLSTL